MPTVEPTNETAGSTAEHFRFLDELRRALPGVNMFSAPTFLQSEFPALSAAQARGVVESWMWARCPRGAK